MYINRKEVYTYIYLLLFPIHENIVLALMDGLPVQFMIAYLLTAQTPLFHQENVVLFVLYQVLQ